MSECTNLTALPTGLRRLDTLNVRGCTKLKSLPDDIQIEGWIEVADSGLDAAVALCATQVARYASAGSDRVLPRNDHRRGDLVGTNLELRRVLIERVGMDWFLDKVKAEVIDSDYDAGGARRLLRIPFGHGPEMLCIEVHCPSTGRKYVLQVPPQMPTCAHAAAWLAGFNNPAHYRPLLET